MPAVQPMSVESMDDFFTKEGPLPTTFDDVRQFPRFFYRACAEAIIHPLGEAQAEPSRAFVLTKDLSRSGVSIVLSSQLFPGQRVDLSLDGKPPLPTVVAWCRRLPDRYFAVGCRFAAADSESAEDAETAAT